MPFEIRPSITLTSHFRQHVVEPPDVNCVIVGTHSEYVRKR